MGVKYATVVSPLPMERLFVPRLKVEAGLLTVIMQLAVLPLPSAAVAVMVAVPAATAVTTPEELTVATLVLLLDQLIFLLVALDGLTVALIVFVPPTVIVADVLSREILVTGIEFQ